MTEITTRPPVTPSSPSSPNSLSSSLVLFMIFSIHPARTHPSLVRPKYSNAVHSTVNGFTDSTTIRHFVMAITVLVAVMQSAASDWAAARLAVAIERVAEALLAEEETQQHILSAHELLRPRP